MNITLLLTKSWYFPTLCTLSHLLAHNIFCCVKVFVCYHPVYLFVLFHLLLASYPDECRLEDTSFILLVSPLSAYCLALIARYILCHSKWDSMFASIWKHERQRPSHSAYSSSKKDANRSFELCVYPLNMYWIQCYKVFLLLTPV